jgi:O-antigen ligase
MKPQQVTALLTFVAAVALALVMGISIATESYSLLIFASSVVVVCILVLMPGYGPLFVFGLLIPFSLPVPFIWNFPFLMIGLGICALKHWLQGGLQSSTRSMNIRTVNISIAVFFVWVFLRYCAKPALPNMLGWGTTVTGFRAWLNYALSFGVVFYLGRLVANREGLQNLMKWVAYISIFFIFILVPATLSKSAAVANFFFQLGMPSTTFDNGMIRFVALPGFGLYLISLLFLPNLFKVNRAAWWSFLALGSAAVFIGGNRSALGMAFVIVTVIPLLRRKFLQLASITGSVLLFSFGIYLAGPTLSRLPYTGFLRPLALISPDLSEATGGAVSIEWREVRWQRGLDEIRKHPLIGVGYGGLENVLESDTQTEEESEDMSLATGGVHNGYIAGALALGIPAALLFIYILAAQIFANARRSLALQKADPMLAEAHCFVCAFLLAYAAGIFVGTDMNGPIIWFFFGLGMFVHQLRNREVRKAIAPVAFVQPALAGQLA